MRVISLAFYIQVHLLILLAVSKSASQLLVRLDKIRAQIRELEIKNKIDLIAHCDGQWEEEKDRQGDGSSTYPRVGIQGLEVGKQMVSHCQIAIHEQSSYHIFQSPRNSYISINNPMTNSIALYSSDCQFVYEIKGNQVKQAFCDRGLCDDGNVVFLTLEDSLLFCSEMRNFTDCATISVLRNAGKGEIVGGALRNKGSGNMEVYVAYSLGEIVVLDGQGKLKLTVSIEPDSMITHFLDMHPYPLIITSKAWILTFENTKYLISPSKCPYPFHKIDRAFLSHPYASHLYAMSQSTITKFEVKAQQKGCEIVHQFYLRARQPVANGEGIAEYKGKVYAEGMIFDVQRERVQQFEDCHGNGTVFNFQMMKNNYRKGFFTIKCTPSASSPQSYLLIFKAKAPEQGSQKSNTIIMIIVILLIVFLLFLFFRSTTPNLDYDEELKYNQNLRYKIEIDEMMRSKGKEKGKGEGKDRGRPGAEGDEEEGEVMGIKGKRQ